MRTTRSGGPSCDFLQGFAPVTFEAWRKDVEASLQGAPFDKKLVTKTHEGYDLQPLYTRADQTGAPAPGVAGFPPFVRGATPLVSSLCGWDLRQTYTSPSIETAAGEILEDLRGGTSGVVLRVHRALRTGSDADSAADSFGVDGIAISTPDELARLLEGVDLTQHSVSFDAGANVLPLLAALIVIARRRGVTPSQLRGDLGMDPLHALVRDGRLPTTLEAAYGQMADLAAWTSQESPRLRAVRVSTVAWHEAGAAAVDEVAIAIATGLEYLRRLTAAGLSVDAAAQQISFAFAVSTDLFGAIAKLRAARRLWAFVVEKCGGSSAAAAMSIHVDGSIRSLTRRDPWVNLLRTTVEGFAAASAGAESISLPCFDQLFGEPDSFGRRMARNTQIILRDESHVHRVVDPAGGSFFVERLTHEITRAAWSKVQGLEKAGSIASQILDGSLAKRVADTAAQRRKAVASRRDPITGVSEFANVGEQPVVRGSTDLGRLSLVAQSHLAAYRRDKATLPSNWAEVSTAGKPLGSLTAAACQAMTSGTTFGALSAALRAPTGSQAVPEIKPLPVVRLAEAFEALRDASDERLRQTGKRPRLFLANMGPIPQHKPRAGFSQNFFAAGGFEVLNNDGFATPEAAADAFVASGAEAAIICSTDATYPELVPPLATLLKARGAKLVLVAGRAGDQEAAYRQAGVDGFIFMGCDVVATLRSFLQTLGVVAATAEVK